MSLLGHDNKTQLTKRVEFRVGYALKPYSKETEISELKRTFRTDPQREPHYREETR